MKNNLSKEFEEIYDAQSNAVFRFCLIRVSDREQALDITQETFVRLWKSMQLDKKIENSKSFIFTIARRLIIDWYRKKKSLSLENLMYSDDDSYDVPDEKSTRENSFVGADGRYLLEKIRELDGSYRDAVYMRFVEDMSPPEIGEVLGISSGAASVRINRGLAQLKEITGNL